MNNSTINPEKEFIMFVDDEPENLRAFDIVFKAYYNVFTAKSATECLDILPNHPFKVIMVDQRMPVMSGSQLIEIIHNQYPHILTIMVTGFSDIESIISALNNGQLWHYVTKPTDNVLLKNIIDKAILQYNTGKENINLLHLYKELNSELERRVDEGIKSRLNIMKEIESSLLNMANTLHDKIESYNKPPDLINDKHFFLKCEVFKLTEREKDVLKHLVLGESPKQIADTLFLSVATIRSHIQNIFNKVEVDSVNQLIVKFI